VPVAETPPPREEHTQRLLVLVKPGGPLVVEVAMTIDGRPFRHSRQELVDALFEDGNKTAGGTWSWTDAIDSPLFAFAAMADGRYQSELQRQQRIRLYDTSRDGTVDRSEVERFVALADGSGPVFSLDNVRPYEDLVDLFNVLDTDSDGKLSGQESLAADTLLKSRDADDDDLIYPAEMTEAAAAGMQPGMRASQTTYRAGPQAVVQLGPGLDAESLYYLLRELYLGADGDLTASSFPLVAGLVPALDKNGNQQLDRDELPGLNEVDPHVRLEANFGRSGELKSGVSLRSLSPELGEQQQIVSELGGSIFIRLPFATLSFRADDQGGDDTQAAEAQFTRLDGDKNGYLEKKELEEVDPMLASTFDSIDSDGDGKLFQADLLAYLRRRQAPGLTRVAATATKQEQAVFAALDLNNDGRLSRRELRSAADFLAKLDGDGDKAVSRAEIPGQWTISLRRGGAGPANAPGMMMPTYSVTARSGPPWFQRTDSNGDGDVSPREFLGTPEQFDTLDTTGDGFIESAEAEAVSAGKPMEPVAAEAAS
jgi:Ca2+-binding EF-hand superfamily protein